MISSAFPVRVLWDFWAIVYIKYIAFQAYQVAATAFNLKDQVAHVSVIYIFRPLPRIEPEEPRSLEGFWDTPILYTPYGLRGFEAVFDRYLRGFWQSVPRRP